MSHVDEGRLQAFLDGELSADEEIRIEDHLTDCIECAALFDEVVEVHAQASRLLSELDEQPATPEYQELVARAAEAEQDQRRSGPSFLLPGLAWAATLVLAFFLGWQASDRSAIVGNVEPAAPARGDSRSSEAPEIAGPEEFLADAVDPDPSNEEATPARQEPSESDTAPPAVAAGEEAGRAPESEAAPEQELDRAAARLEPLEQELRSDRARGGDELRMQAAPVAPPAGEWEAEEAGERLEVAAPFVRIAPSEVVERFGAEPLRPAGADLREMAIGPPGTFPEGLDDGPVLRSTYDLPGRAGRWMIWQQRTTIAGESEPPTAVALRRLLESSPAGVQGDGLGMIEWSDPRGFRVRMAARLPVDELRDLAMQLELR